MLKQLRDARPEEIENIKDKSNLNAASIILAEDSVTEGGGGPILGVVRNVIELDPVFFPEGCSTRRKAIFIRDAETFLIAKGWPEYYFNIEADENSAEWRAFMEKAKAVKAWSTPVYRYRMSLI